MENITSILALVIAIISPPLFHLTANWMREKDATSPKNNNPSLTEPQLDSNEGHKQLGQHSKKKHEAASDTLCKSCKSVSKSVQTMEVPKETQVSPKNTSTQKEEGIFHFPKFSSLSHLLFDTPNSEDDVDSIAPSKSNSKKPKKQHRHRVKKSIEDHPLHEIITNPDDLKKIVTLLSRLSTSEQESANNLIISLTQNAEEILSDDIYKWNHDCHKICVLSAYFDRHEVSQKKKNKVLKKYFGECRRHKCNIRFVARINEDLSEDIVEISHCQECRAAKSHRASPQKEKND